MISFAKRVVYNVFACNSEPLDLELDEDQRAAATQAYNDKFASNSIWHLCFLCGGHVVHIVAHSARYNRRLPAVLSTLMLLVTMLTIWLGFRLKSRRSFGPLQIVLALPFLFHHLALIPAEKWVSILLFFEFNPLFSYLTPGPSDCFSFEACKAAQNGDHLAGYCYTPSRVDVENLWTILLLDVFHILMVLSAKTGLLLFVPGLAMYILPVLLLGGRLDSSGWSIVVLAVCVNFMCICTRFAKDSATRKLMTLVEFQRKHIIEEKLKRCEAEFESDRLKSSFLSLSSNKCGERPVSSVPSVTSGGQTQMSLPASAPATCLLPHKSSCNGADCLLETSRVYIEGATNSLQELRELKEGQRVLCQDALTGSFEFVTVSGIKAEPCPDEIIRLVLEDASIIDMTADHPMPALLDDGSHGHSLGVLQAQKLSPGSHVVSTWQRRDLKLKEVLRITPDLSQDECSKQECAMGEERNESSQLKAVAVSTQNPMRYKMLVAGPKGLTLPGNDPAVIAVGFANLDLLNVHCRATFLDGSIEETGATLRRTVSAPAFCEFSPSFATTAESTQCSEPVQHDVKSQETQHDIGSLPSVGSTGHREGNCKPCNIHSRFLRGDLAHPCKFGAACTFCHEYHDKRERRIIKYTKRHQPNIQAL